MPPSLTRNRAGGGHFAGRVVTWMEQLPALGSREEKRAFFRWTMRIAAPMVAQNLMNTAVNAVDVVMLSFVSQAALGASSLAGQVAFVLEMLTGGVCAGGRVLAAQYWGKGDRRAVERVLGLAVRVALGIGALFTLAAALWPGLIMGAMTRDEAMIREGARYLRLVSAAYVLSAVGTVYLGIMQSVERVRLSAAVHCGALVVNAALNACFIFGLGFFPKLGIGGVALATSITRMLEVLVCLADNAASRTVRLRLRYLVARDGPLMRAFARYAIPTAANEAVWGLAFSVYAVILGHLSSDIVAANALATVCRNMGTIASYGLASAAAVILGKLMGSRQLARARAYADRLVRLCLWASALGTVVILACRPWILGFAAGRGDFTPGALHDLGVMLWINAYYLWGGSVNSMLICGIFRAGGDVQFGLKCDIIDMWVYAVPAGLLCAFVLHLPELWVYFVLCLDEFVKIPFVWRHYRRGAWLRDITGEQEIQAERNAMG